MGKSVTADGAIKVADRFQLGLQNLAHHQKTMITQRDDLMATYVSQEASPRFAAAMAKWDEDFTKVSNHLWRMEDLMNTTGGRQSDTERKTMATAAGAGG